MPKTKDQKGKKRWLNARKTHKAQNWAAFQVTSDELTLFSFPLNCRFLKLTCLYKSDQSEGWEVLACTQGRLPLLTYMWYELAMAEKKLRCLKNLQLKADGWTDGRTGSQPSELLPALTELASEKMVPDERSTIYPAHETIRCGWNVQQANQQTGPPLLRDHLVKDWLSSVGDSKPDFWPLRDDRLIENAPRRAGARLDH